MKILKRIAFVILGIIAIALIAAIFVKKDYMVEREIVINKPKEEVFNYIKYIRNQDNYSKWVMMDPNMKREYRGEDGKKGFVSAWDSENGNVGKGEQELMDIQDGERIDLKVRFIKPFEGLADAYMTTASIEDNKTLVKWGFKSSMAYPSNLMLLFMDIEGMIGNDLQTGLNNLKTVMEK